MNKTYLKNILRDIKNTKGKVLSIMLMVGLAASVVVGMSLSGVTMRNSLDKSLRTYGHPDVIVRSTYGLDYEDELILNRDPDIEKITMVKTADLIDGETLIRVKALNQDIPKSVVLEGRMPESANEIALDTILSDQYKIGDKISLSYVENSRIDDEVMKNLDYVLVGFFHTSDYFMEDMRELSFAAKKELDGYAYVLEENFDTDKFGEANIIYKQSLSMDKTTVAYKDFAYEKADEIEEKLANRPGQVLASIKSEAQDEISDAEAEITDAKKEISDAEKKLTDARAELDDGFRDYEDGKDEYQTEIAKAKNDLAKARADLIDGQKQLDQGRAEYEANLADFRQKISDAEAELADNEAKLNEATEKLKAGQDEIDAGYNQLNAEFEDPRRELAKAKDKLDQTKAQIDGNKNELDQAFAVVNEGELELEQKSQELDKLEEQINTILYGPGIEGWEQVKQMQAQLEAGRAQVTEARKELTAKKAQLETGRSELEAGILEYQKGLGEYQANKEQVQARFDQEKEKLDSVQAEVDQKKEELAAGWESLNQGKDELEANKADGQARLDEALAEINANQAEIDQGWASYRSGQRELADQEAQGKKDLEDAYQKLLDGEEEYQENLAKFQKEKADAMDDIAEGEEEIEDGKKAILRLTDPEYDVETIYDNQGIKTYQQNSLNMDELTKVFPTFFYLVAMLVTLTTMKRYIDEQRTINGTLKALGYTSKQISQRFYLYGIIPTLVGSLIGALAGRYIISKVIINAYGSGFASLQTVYENTWPYIVFAIGLSVGLIALTVYFSSRETVKQTPANLLREKAPNIGKKVFLEKISPLWKRMSFMQKVTARNLFRYKARMFMTLFGVGGCTALTFFGFAMTDSVKDTASTQQNVINHYDVIAMVDEKAPADELADFDQAVRSYKSLDIRYEDATINFDGSRRDVSIVVADAEGQISDFVTLRTPKRELISLDEEGGVISEKAAKVLGISIGDKISIRHKGQIHDIPITNIMENYTGDYIFIGKKSFEKITGTDVQMNAKYLKGSADNVIKDIEDQKAVVAIINASVIYASMDVLLANLNLVIGVITVISIMLALVVLYNLININVSERRKELATIKVLGFYAKEVTSYIFREISILTILGIVVGYGLGYAMFSFIISVVAPDNIMLYYRVSPEPYVFSALITLSILLVLLVLVHKNLKKINMAEAMSSGE